MSPKHVLALAALCALLLAAAPPPAPAAPPFDRSKVTVYCAGPMDNAQDFADQRALAAQMRKAGYQVYLPVDDGFSLILMYQALAESGRPPVAQEEARYWLMVAVYTLDMYSLLERCNAAVANVNPFQGAVNPDAGTTMEISVAAAYGMPIAFYKTSVPRLLPPGTVYGTGWDNPMVVGLSGDFSLKPGYAVQTPADLVTALDRACAAAGPLEQRDGRWRFAQAMPLDRAPRSFRDAVALGQKVAAMKEKYRGKTFDLPLALAQTDEVVALMRAEAHKHGVAPFRP